MQAIVANVFYCYNSPLIDNDRITNNKTDMVEEGKYASELVQVCSYLCDIYLAIINQSERIMSLKVLFNIFIQI